MKKIAFVFLLTVVFSLVLAACSGHNKEAAPETSVPPKQIIEQILKQHEQPPQMDLDAEMVRTLYHLDPAVLEEFSIKSPLMNVKTNEVAVLKVKDAKDVATVEAAVKQRAADVQKQFETYLPDQYENAKNYKLVVKGNYVLFVISENADDIVHTFEGFFAAK